MTVTIVVDIITMGQHLNELQFVTWHTQVEDIFDLWHFTSQSATFLHVTSPLSTKVVEEFQDVDTPQDNTPYDHFKTMVLQRESVSARKRLQQLLNEEELGGHPRLELIRREWHPGCDFRALNAPTFPDPYPLTLIHDFPANLHGTVIFHRIISLKAYHQPAVESADNPKTAVVTPIGHIECIHMPFGLRNAVDTFERFIKKGNQGPSFEFA
nr:uncharacterized protein LOC126522949 [Dermacentor andersoni]